ncbi:hypothetical protein BDF19DRAFT_445763 [Syncephalis fuscata]|nr:hypothetical protein BDF19DRAFT_445763 [Syncephalis fuscata]
MNHYSHQTPLVSSNGSNPLFSPFIPQRNNNIEPEDNSQCANNERNSRPQKRSQNYDHFDQDNEDVAVDLKRLRTSNWCHTVKPVPKSPQLHSKRRRNDNDDDDYGGGGDNTNYYDEHRSFNVRSPSMSYPIVSTPSLSSSKKRARYNDANRSIGSATISDHLNNYNGKSLSNENSTRLISMDTWEPLPSVNNNRQQVNGDLLDATMSEQQQQPSNVLSLDLVPWSQGKSTTSRLPDKITFPSSSDHWWCAKETTIPPIPTQHWSHSNYTHYEDNPSTCTMALYRPNNQYPITEYQHSNYPGLTIEELPSEDEEERQLDSNYINDQPIVDMTID